MSVDNKMLNYFQRGQSADKNKSQIIGRSTSSGKILKSLTKAKINQIV